MTKAKELKKAFDVAKQDRSNFDIMFQTLGEYISLVKQNFEGQPANGEFLMDDIFDSTGAFAAHNSASAFLGMLWAGSARQSIELIRPEDVEETTELDEFYSDLSNGVTRAMDDPKAGLALALDEYMLDQKIFGTSGVGVELGEESDLSYSSYSVTNLYLDEGKNGRVNKIWLMYEWDIGRVVEEYGIENVSDKTKELYNAGKKEKIKILVTIQKRKELKAEKGVLAKPYESIHIEYAEGHQLKESGFDELPIPICRARKLGYEKYGRSDGMNAIPDIKELNTLRESGIVATEKGLDMPIGVLNDGIAGGGYVDTSPRAITVFENTYAGNSPPVFEIGQPPRMDYAQARYEELKEAISQHFAIDRLLDFNNDVQMTFGEAQIRDNARIKSLQGLFARQITELFTPLIERSVNLLWRRGDFGVVRGSDEEERRLAEGLEVKYFPDEIVKRIDEDKDIYTIRYKTSAQQASRAEDYLAILDIMQLVAQGAQIKPDIVNRIDFDAALKEIGDIRSIPTGIILPDDKVEEIEAQQQEGAESQQMLDTMEQGANIAQTVASAESTLQ